MEEQQDYKVFWIVMLALLLMTRIPVMASYLSIDNVNLAFSLERFDPRVHQPHPPGYPFFVGFAHLVHFIFRDPERTFAAISILVSGLCLPLAFMLGGRMFSQWAGAAGASLLLLNPVFWHSSLDGPLRPNLALFSLLTAYCCWRCWNGEKRFAVWGAVALGIGSGFRPDLLAFLLPIWLVSSWAGTRSWRAVLQACGVLAVIVFVWVGALILAMQGATIWDSIATFNKLMLDYAVDQSRSQWVALGSSLLSWVRQINRLAIWNGLAVVTWIWALPFYFRNRDRLPLGSAQAVFFFIWLVPGLVIQALIHFGAPEHTLFSVAALCVLGGHVLSLVPGRDLLLTAGLVVNTMLFLNFIALPAGATKSRQGLPSIKNALIVGTVETSLDSVRRCDELTRSTLKEIEEFTPKHRPSIIISTNGYVDQFFMNWRIGRYYLPERDFWVLYNDTGKRRAERRRRELLIEMRDTTPLRVPIFRKGRILWLIEPDSAFHKELAGVQMLSGGRHVFYSDITRESAAFTVDGFEILPALLGFRRKSGTEPCRQALTSTSWDSMMSGRNTKRCATRPTRPLAGFSREAGITQPSSVRNKSTTAQTAAAARIRTSLLP